MSYRVELSAHARRDLLDCIAYFTRFSDAFAMKQIERLDDVFANSLSQSPTTWNFFYVTGAPYRAYLFRVGRRTSYWIVYTVDEADRKVKALRIWNASRRPSGFSIR